MSSSFYLKKGWIATFTENNPSNNGENIIAVDRDQRNILIDNKLAEAYSFNQVIQACNLQIDRHLLN